MEFVGLSDDVTLCGSGWDNVNSQIGVALNMYFLPVIVDVFVYYLLTPFNFVSLISLFSSTTSFSIPPSVGFTNLSLMSDITCLH